MKELVLNTMQRFGIPTKGIGYEYIKNTGWVTGAKILESIISYVIIVLISRYLGAEGLGQYSFLFSFSGLIFIFADLGLSTLLIKDLAVDVKKINTYISNILTLKIFMSLAIFIIYAIVVQYIGKKELLIPLIIVGLMQIFSSLRNVPNGLLRVKNKGKIIAVANIVERIVALIGISAMFLSGGKITGVVIILFISSFILTSINFFFAKKHFKYSFTIKGTVVRRLLKLSFPFLLVTLFSVIYIQMDTIMLSFIKGDIVVGWYQSGYKLINMINIISGLLLMFGFPLFSQLYHTNKQEVRKLLEKILQTGMYLLLPIVAGVFIIGNRIIEFIYSFQAAEASTAFTILIVAEVFIFLTTILGTFIAAVNKQWIFAKIAGFGAAINILLNFLLIPTYSLYGAGIATLITYILMFIIMYVYTYRKLVVFSFWKQLLMPIISSGVMYIVLTQILVLNTILLIIIGAVVYFLINVLSYQILRKIEIKKS